jgi:iron complex outermembrane recepter protein
MLNRAGCRRLLTAGVTMTAVAFTGAGALAADVDEITEILVTSRKKEERLFDVPVAITAFTADVIEQAGIRDLYDIAELTPGLSFFNAQGEFLAVPVIRGVAPTDINGENNAAIFVDGVYVSGREGLNFSQLDLERIEVVKGPQSALYGRNAFSGAINYVTRLPSETFETKGDVTYGNDGRYGGQASVSGPIWGDSLRGRIATLYDNFDGSYDNTLGGEDIGGYKYRSTQGSLLWEPTEKLQVVGSMYYSNDEIDDAATTGVAANCENRVDSNLAITRLLNVCGEVPTVSELAAQVAAIGTPSALANAALLASDGIPKLARALGEDRDLIRGHLNIDWDLGFGSLTFLTGYSDTSQRALVDGNRSLGDQIPFVICANGSGGVCPGAKLFYPTGLLQIEQEDTTQEISQEIRFTSAQDEAFRYSGGWYYFDVSSKGRDGGVEATAPAPGLNQYFGPYVGPGITIGDGAFRPWFRPNGDLDPNNRVIEVRDTTSWSLFGSAEYDLTERLTVDAQLRYGEEDKFVTGYLWDESDLTLSFPLLARSGEDTFDAWTGRLGLKFQVSDGWMLYTSLANSEKSGGFDINNISTTDDPDTPTVEVARNDITVLPFDNETIVAAEIGMKGTSSDGRLALDVSLYRLDWDDIVVPEVYERDPITNEPYSQPESFNVNAGDATVLGWEVDLTYQISDSWRTRLTGSFTDATFDNGRQGTFDTFPSFRPPECQAATVTTTPEGRDAEQACQAVSGSIAGNTVLRQPKWQSSFSLAYDTALTDGWDLFASGDASYQGKVYVGNDNQSFLPARTYVNLRLGVESARYSVELWGRNVFNNDEPIAAYRDVFFTNTDDYFQEAAATSPADKFFPIRYTVSHPRLRTFGITGRVRFGGAER